MSVERGTATYDDVIIELYILHYLTQDSRILYKQNPAPDLPQHKNFHFLGDKNHLTINASLHTLYFVLSQKVLIAETRFKLSFRRY